MTVAPVSASDNASIVEAPVQKLCSPVGKPVLYVIEKGDHLADIIRTFGFRPLYGKRSRVTQVSKMNEILNPDLIFPGQEVHLPFECEEDTAKYVLIEREQDRIIHPKHLAMVRTKIYRSGRRETVMLLPSGDTVPFNVADLPNLNQANLASEELRSPAQVAGSEGAANDLRGEGNREDTADNKEPAPAKNIELAQNSFSPHSSLSAGLLYGFYRLDSIETGDNATALLLSRPSTGFAFSWLLHWTPQLSTGFNFALRQIEMRRAATGSLVGGQQTTSGMGVDAHYQWTSRFKSILGVNYEEELFVRSVRSGTALMEVYQQPNLDLRFEHEMARSGALSFDLVLGYRQMLKTSTEAATIYDSGEYQMGANLRQQLEKLQIELKLRYLKGRQKSTLTEQDNTGIESQFGVKVEIGP